MRKLESRRPRVVIVDDSRTMQAVLEQLLTLRLRYEIVGIASDGRSAVAIIEQTRPDLVTIDLTLPYIDGRQLLEALHIFPEMKKVVVSAAACENLAVKASLEKLGADSCVSKSRMSQDPDGFCHLIGMIMRNSKKLQEKASLLGMPAPAPLRGSSGSGKRIAALPILSYPIPTDEVERRAALQGLGLANDNVDRRLDLLTEHLAKTTSYPACAMTFIDQHTQWIKSSVGVDRGFTPRSEAICNYTICGDDPFIVSDTHADIRFAKLEVVLSGPMIRSYVGLPIIGSSGVRLGALCLLDTKPRRVTVEELTNLRSIARIAAELVEARWEPIRYAA
ncbi:hypothetical protein GCM10008023_42220 [Sphingomonas glacialis]|uniref:Response regulatory domain-containing protein n=1 Tax=Sphingomonas glacialis TaxID=658225 RepID=A0ABQ3LWK8_9SPHN|nr:response regulator [Sphingomonas glacialis]GHH27031.1 hypothetical protein GCM10008023_42220 [Sphingomonas glacialis]